MSPKQPTPPQTPATNNRYLCVHGHFYQPPRENPWLETIELQDSAAPFHDWNERITAECYAPNGASRITNAGHQIVRIVNNYARMSFNFGPTLLSWLEDFAPRAYRMIQDADRVSAERYSNHGSALAQVYNHLIMPLASERDARTQIRWGIADFEHRFGRKPEGMWLAETAVNRQTLDLLAQERIKFTVLAPNQAARIRKLPGSALPSKDLSSRPESASFADAAERPAVSAPTTRTPNPDASSDPNPPTTYNLQPTTPWTPTPNATVDPTQPYLVQLDEGRSIAVFFYDGPASRAIAFEGLLNDGETFANRLLSRFQPEDRPQLAHVATDGESYGHHHKRGEMALSYALHYIEENNLATLTNYAEFLEKFPPTWEAEVVEDSSWSCEHGVERWRSNCGCNGGKPGYNQRWRGPLRDALDLLRDRTAPLAEAVAKPLLNDLWAARDAYIHVILDRSADNVDRFLAAHATHTLTPAERVTVFELLELQRHTQLMYTSCGWFFDDISGIETVQIIAYAGRVLQLAHKLFSDVATNLETDFLTLLAQAKSNDPAAVDGAEVYRNHVLPTRLDLESVGAHYAISSMFRAYPDAGQIFCFDVRRHACEVLSSGRGRFAVGQASLKSRITEETEDICFAVLHLGDQNLSAAVKRFHPDDATASNRSSSDPLNRSSSDLSKGNSLGFEGAGLQPRHQTVAKDGALAPEGLSDQAAWAAFTASTRASIRRANLPELIRAIDHQFGGTLYSLTSLFADEQHRILQSILDTTVTEVEDWLLRIYSEHATLLDFLAQANVPVPPALAVTAGFAINASLRRAIEAEAFDSAEIAALLRRAALDHVSLDVPLLSYTADRRMKRSMVRLEAALEGHALPQSGLANQTSGQPGQLTLAVVNETLAIAETLQTLPMEINLWQAQNIWNDLLRRSDATYWSREWREGFRKIGLALNISVDDLVTDSGVRAF